MRLSNIRTKVLAFVAPLFVIALIAASAFAQSGTTGITGTVVDQAGSVVPGATVTISNPATGLTRTTTTNTNGRFSFASIPPATYRLEVESAGFKKVVNSSVQALVNSPLDLSLRLNRVMFRRSST
jgi:type 1 fimbria pilin